MKLNDGLTDAEKLYKSLYLQFPQVWEEPTQDWEELVRRYHRLGIRQIPPQPPSVMGTVMTEEDFFYGRAKEVVCFNNLRYCPPFLHKLEFIKIVYVWRGCVTLYMDGRKCELTSGNFCIITPGVKHTVFSRKDEDVIVNILMRTSSFSDAFSGILREQNILTDFFWKILYTKHSNRVLIFACENDAKLDRWVEKMFDESARGENASNLLMKSYAMIFLGIVRSGLCNAGYYTGDAGPSEHNYSGGAERTVPYERGRAETLYREGERLYLALPSPGFAPAQGGGAFAPYPDEYGKDCGGDRIQQYEQFLQELPGAVRENAHGVSQGGRGNIYIGFGEKRLPFGSLFLTLKRSYKTSFV